MKLELKNVLYGLGGTAGIGVIYLVIYILFESVKGLSKKVFEYISIYDAAYILMYVILGFCVLVVALLLLNIFGAYLRKTVHDIQD